MSGRRRIGLVFLLFMGIFVLLATPLVYQVLRLPEHRFLLAGEEEILDIGLPLSIYLSHADGQIHVGEELFDGGHTLDGLRSLKITAEEGQYDLEFRLFGIPIRKMSLNAVGEIMVYPGGHSIGVLLGGRGLIISGHVPVRGFDGVEKYPAVDAGLQVGDRILSINGRGVDDITLLQLEVNQAGNAGRRLQLEVERDGRQFTTQIEPVRVQGGLGQPQYLIGLYIQDPAAGVGTLSFYCPETYSYGALGHVILDHRTNRKLDVDAGRIVSASISGIQMGTRGRPGEKLGTFREDSPILGTVESNTDLGIFGRLDAIGEHPFYSQPIPVSLAHQVQEGKAEILTVVRGDRIERFEIEILRVNRQNRPDGKGLIIQVTDPTLLEITGGIVQGMSGSPIIQNGRLVGAVTHVFLNDPTRGYGIMAEWMIREAGLLLVPERAA